MPLDYQPLLPDREAHRQYRKKPVIIHAVLWDGSNVDEVLDFAGGAARRDGDSPLIDTLEGTMTASRGDWIIRGTKGEYYPCKPDIFSDIYERPGE